MATTTTSAPCGCSAEGGGLERVRFFPGQVLTATDMTDSVNWALAKVHRHNVFEHGWGVVCGCDVRPPAPGDSPWSVRICPGYVVTPQGDEVLIAAGAAFDLVGCGLSSQDPCAYARPCPPVGSRRSATKGTAYIAVRYLECQARPVSVAPMGCGCEAGSCDFTRIQECYEFGCLDQVPAAPPTYGCDHLCNGDPVACPDCSGDGWVVLATVNLPASTDVRLTATNISLADRPRLYSAAMLMEMALCACGPTPTPVPQPTPTPIAVEPQAPPPVITPASGTFPGAVDVTMSDALSGASIYYTIDGSTPTAQQGQRYGGKFTLTQANGTLTVKAIAVAAGYTPSGVTSAAYDFYTIG